MKLFHLLRKAAVSLAVCGLCLPGSSALGTDTPAPAKQTSARVQDVALAPGGLLVGQVVDESMQPRSGSAVTVQSNGQIVATTTTDANGEFSVAGLRGGVHHVVVDESIRCCRLWAPGTAPPQSAARLRFLPGQENVVRGQWGQPPSFNGVAGWVTNPWVITGVVATAIAVPIVLHNLDDDDDGS